MRQTNASAKQIESTRLALEEVAEIFEPYSGAVLIGGHVPLLLIPQNIEAHEGTIDIDMILHPQKLSGDDELTLHEQLLRRNFVQDTVKPFRFTKVIDQHTVLLELLAGGTPPQSGMFQIVREDVFVSVIHGLEVAFDFNVAVSVSNISGSSLNVASLPSFLAMKAAALASRENAKDAYDIVYCLRRYPGGLDAIVAEFEPAVSHPLVLAGIRLLGKLFWTVDSVGPVAYASNETDKEESALRRREAHVRVNDLLDRLP
jgi:Nucleotidyl transferase AbiEii toxin, Type IV TA system